MALQRILTRRVTELCTPLHQSPAPSLNPLQAVIGFVLQRLIARPEVCSAVPKHLQPTVMSVTFVVIREGALFVSTEVPID